MFRMLIVAVILTVAVVKYMPNHLDEVAESGTVQAVRDFGEGTVPMFRSRLDAGASCAELISIRDTYDPLSTEVTRMNEELREIGCTSVSARRSE